MVPAVSEKQRRAMFAAAEGKSTIGIPQSVGEEFVGKDALGGPQRAAGTIFAAPDGSVLLLCRSDQEANYGGHWSLPGGKGEDGETPWEIACREACEEIGSATRHAWVGEPTVVDEVPTPNGMVFTTFVQPVRYRFTPEIDGEHCGFCWVKAGNYPSPMHPQVARVLAKVFPEGTEMKPQAQDAIAMDKNTVRRVDADGHMFVEMTPISKANVCDYYGKEIPGWDKLGLDPDKLYKLYRDPDELARAAPSFAGKPLLIIHKPINASDHPREIVVGSIGDDVKFKAPYLMAPLNIWDAEAIALIESEEQRELSSAYRYTPDMTPGTANGEAYDGVMRDISANHLALVRDGRAGPDCLVMDSAIQTQNGRVGPNGDNQQEQLMKKKTVLSRKASVAHGAILAYLMPKLAQDAKIDLTPTLKGVTSANFEAKKASIVDGVKKATAGKLAQDADIEDVVTLIDALKTVEAAEEEEALEKMPGTDNDMGGAGGVREFLAGKLSAEDMKAYDEMMAASQQEAMDEDDEEKRDNEAEGARLAAREKREQAEDEEDKKDMVTKPAMDAAINAAVKRVQENARAVRAAEDDVRPYIGSIAMACDSAEDVYRTALTSLNVDIAGVHPSAFKAILKTIPVPGSQRVAAPAVAMDAKAANSFHELFPGAKTHVVKHL